jgi:Arc/MetJ-type ribon-helix-helix transcriptional regulator
LSELHLFLDRRRESVITIRLPKDVETSVTTAVRSGDFASVDDALAEAWRTFQRRRDTPLVEAVTAATSDPVLGSMRDYADEMDEIVADAMKKRREEPWRVIPSE